MPNSVAIVTGASQGIGKATALLLARDFSSLVLIARDEAQLQERAQQAKTFGAESLVLLAFLVSSPAKWLTGASLRMDGGEFKGI